MKLGKSPDTMIVYKALKDGVSPYQHTAWPLPKGDQPGDWLSGSGKPELCKMGVHGYLTEKQAKDAGNQVFEMEIEGDIVKDGEKAAGRRGRLLRQLSGERVVTLGEVIAAGRKGPAGASFLRRAALHLGVVGTSLQAALAKTDLRVVADDDGLVPLDRFVDVPNITPDDVERRVGMLARMPLKVQFG